MAEYLHDWEMKWKKITAEVDKKGKLLGRLPSSTESSFAIVVGVVLKATRAKLD